MSAQQLLEQLLKSGSSALGSVAPRSGGDVGKYAVGGIAGGLIGLLIGSKRKRGSGGFGGMGGLGGMGGKAVKYGSAAAIGALAWKVYSDYQARQKGAAVAPPAAGAGAAWTPAPATPQGFASLPPPALEDHSRAMLKALIAGAKADGHVDDRERELIGAELQRLGAEPADRAWVDGELRRPLEPAEVASGAKTPEMAAEMYLASLLVVDETTTMERAYLDALARELRLPAELKADLEARAAAA